MPTTTNPAPAEIAVLERDILRAQLARERKTTNP